MRFDILDEYSTVVPFSMGLFKNNRVLKIPSSSIEENKSPKSTSHLSRLKALVMILINP